MSSEMTWGRYEPAQAPGSPIRATDRDRDAAIGVVQACFAEGRLTKEEHDARVARALSAQTYAELDPLTADLPVQPVYPDAPVPPAPRHLNGLAIAALVCGVAQPFTFMLSTIPAIILGHRARGQIRRSGDDGRSMATWGMVLGWAGLATAIMFVLAIVSLTVLVASAAHGTK